MSVVRVGTSSKYASGWDAVFGGATSARSAGRKAMAVKSSAKKSAGKKAVKASAKKTPKTKTAKKAAKRR